MDGGLDLGIIAARLTICVGQNLYFAKMEWELGWGDEDSSHTLGWLGKEVWRHKRSALPPC